MRTRARAEPTLIGMASLTDRRSFPRRRESSQSKGTFPKACGVDSRLRGNDDSVERRCLANDATTPALHSWMSWLQSAIMD